MRIPAAVLTLALLSQAVLAGPHVEAGDLALRHDLQTLSDFGIVSGPVSTWPLAWGPILEDLRSADLGAVPDDIIGSVLRVRARAERETRVDDATLFASAAVAEKPARIRSFQDTPRGQAEISAGASWLSERFNVDLRIQAVKSDQDSEELRFDKTSVGVVFGNWSITANTLDRWWGPGWDGSLILSNNARPFPALSIDRVFTDGFESKWLSWIGPWDLSVLFGQLEAERYVPNTQFFGMRFGFKPLQSLEIGVSRSAQWCGDGRPCDLETFADLIFGRDNRGDEGIDANNEPGNQLAGFDVRWVPGFRGRPLAVYGQFIGEDEAGGLPSRWMGQLGFEWSGLHLQNWSSRIFGEYADTSCDFPDASAGYNCAYNHGTYRTGYRYRSRVIGHAAENDSRMYSAGITLVNDIATQWNGIVRSGTLNRAGAPDPANSLTPTRQEILSLDISYSREFSFGEIDLGAGFEQVEDISSAREFTNSRFYVQWQNLF